MKRQLLLGLVGIVVAFSSFSQNATDDVTLRKKKGITSPLNATPKAVSIGGLTVNGEILPCGSTSTTLSVSGACSYEWFSDNLGVNSLGSDVPLTVNGITSDTTVYLGALAPDTAISLPLPSYSGPFSGNARGYWFQAPSDFNISGLRVPTDASNAATQSLAIVRFNTSAPPTYATTTNDFTVLGLWQNVTDDTINVCIPVVSGDYIGILGVRGGVNSYATGPFTSTINGTPVTLTRMGMQFDLNTTAPQDLWQEPGGSISRVEIIYGNNLVSTSATPSPITIQVPYPSATSVPMGICQGDSVYLGGAYQFANGTFLDSLQTIAGCDSLATTVLTVYPSYNYVQSIDLCPGDSVLINGTYVSSNGAFLEQLQTVNGCDSTVSTLVNVSALPNASVNVDASGIVLTAATSGATYQWLDCDNGNTPIAGATNQSYTATSNGNYALQITVNGCDNTSACTEVNSVGIPELGINFTLYPNPTSDNVYYSYTGSHALSFTLTDLNGKVLWKGTAETPEGTVNLDAFASGSYFLNVTSENKSTVLRIVKR